MKICIFLSRPQKRQKRKVRKANHPQMRSFYIRVKARFEGKGKWYYRRMEDWEIREYAATGKISIHPYNVMGRSWYSCLERTTQRYLTVLNGGPTFSGFYVDYELKLSGFATLRQLLETQGNAVPLQHVA